MSDLTLLQVTLGLYGSALGGTLLERIFRRRPLARLASVSLWAGVGFHLATVVARGVAARHFPVASFYESLLFITLTTAVIFAVVDRVMKIPLLRIFLLLSLVAALVSALSLDRSIEPLVPALRSIWIQIHVPTMMVSYGAFAVAAFISILDLVSRKRSPRPELEQLTAILIAFGFIFLTIGIMLGAVWANEAWGTYWGWDPKETCALMSWLIYAIYLHGKYVTGWKGTRLAWVSILGFSAILFTYLGVSFLLSGQHSYIS